MQMVEQGLEILVGILLGVAGKILFPWVKILLHRKSLIGNLLVHVSRIDRADLPGHDRPFSLLPRYR